MAIEIGSYTINGNDWTLNHAGNTSYAAQILGSGSSAITINDDRVEANITTPLLNSVGTVSFDYAFVNGSASNTFVLQTSTRWCNLYYGRHTHIRYIIGYGLSGKLLRLR